MRPKKETLEHRQAFDLYLSMGKDRSTALVAQQIGKSKAAIDGWSSVFGWVKRVDEAEARIAAKASAKVEESLAEYDAKLVSISNAVIGLFVKRVRAAVDEDGNLKPRGYKPSALDAKIWAQLKRDIVSKGSTAPEEGGFDEKAAEELGVERIERIVLERVTRLTRARARRAETGGDLGVGA